MKILLVHTFYNQKGGEDVVFESEKELLSKYHEVEEVKFFNKDLDDHKNIANLPRLIYNKDSANILRKAIRSFKPDVLHLHNLFYIGSPSLLYVACKEGIPMVMTLHNYRIVCSNSLLLRNEKVCELCTKKTFPLAGIRNGCFQDSKLKTAALTLITGIHKFRGTWHNKVKKYIVFSEFQKSKLLNSSLGAEEDQFVVKPNFVKDEGFETAEKREDYFLFVGRLSKEKGIHLLLEAAQKGSFKLEIVGGGILEDEIHDIAERNDNVIFHGFKEKAFIMDKMKSCKALVFPSIWYEGMPITILESFSTGTPIIISDIDNLNTLVKDQYNGLHFETNNVDSLLEKIEIMQQLRDYKLYENARKTYIEKYSPEVNYKQLVEIYSSVTNNDSTIIN